MPTTTIRRTDRPGDRPVEITTDDLATLLSIALVQIEECDDDEIAAYGLTSADVARLAPSARALIEAIR